MPALSHLLFALLALQALAMCSADLVVAMSSDSSRADNKVIVLSFCLSCPSPRSEGTVAYGLLPRHGLQDFQVDGALVACVPNSAESKRILNPSQVNGRIVMVNRSQTPLLDKVDKLVKAGALGIIIADDGRCSETFSTCGAQAGNSRDGFSPLDSAQRWRLSTPVVMVGAKTADLLRSMMRLREVDVARMGVHNMTLLEDDWDEL
ncbi:hypothetical protein B484DRAFT_449254 [Ochromonadaceae sp. CCMP2298]|nr:hypothetical protein B484DRAFT_449254 [Ochromonadaceae sp. CCMP2298]|mmetsp:Transcript_21832/g.48561  ORF Transcript_21832/g.48561 Transcript_21832/m.48561 type:complete len:206 (+) Transcript_21832:78-695(+)